MDHTNSKGNTRSSKLSDTLRDFQSKVKDQLSVLKNPMPLFDKTFEPEKESDRDAPEVPNFIK